VILVAPRARYTAWRRDKTSLPREAWVLISANVVSALGYGVVSPVLPAFARTFGVSMSSVTLAITMFSVMRLCFAPPSGMMVQRWGERPVYLTGLVIGALATGACAFVHSFWELLVFRAIGGIGSTMFFISALGLMIRISPVDARGRVAGLFASSFLVGLVAGPLMGSLTAGLGLRAPFVIYGAVTLVTAVVVSYSLRHSTLSDRVEHADAEVTLRIALRHRAYRSALVSNFATGWSVFGVRMAVVPLFIADVLHRGPRMTGLALAMFAAGNVAVVLPSGYLSDRIGRRLLLISGLLASGVATIGMGASTSLTFFLVAACIAGATSGVFASPQQAAIADILGNGARAGTAVAAFQMVADLGAIVGAIAVAHIAEHVGFGWGFIVSGLILMAAAVVWVFAPETQCTDALAPVDEAA
jgi:ACDE family multidrug resistance protein